jgi:hypothetical protein
MGKKQNSDFRQFWDVPRYHGNRTFKIEQAVTEALVQLTFVPSFISIETFYIEVWTCNGSFFNENNLNNYLNRNLFKHVFAENIFHLELYACID